MIERRVVHEHHVHIEIDVWQIVVALLFLVWVIGPDTLKAWFS